MKLIDISDLGKEIQENFLREQKLLPQIAELENRVNELKWEVEKLYACLDKEIRRKSDKKLTEKSIENEIKTSEQYCALMEQYLTARAELNKLKAKEKIVHSMNKNIDRLMIWIRYQLRDEIDSIALATMMEDIKAKIDFNDMWRLFDNDDQKASNDGLLD